MNANLTSQRLASQTPGMVDGPNHNDDRDPWDVPTQPDLPEPGDAAATVVAFHRKLAEVHVECSELGSALDRRDPVGVEIAACDLTTVWLDAKAALNLAEARASTALEQARVATLVLGAGHQVLTRLFAHALEETSRWGTDAPRLHDVLCRLGATLGLTITDPADGRL